MKTVVIFGGSGFIGRNIIHLLTRRDFRLIVPYQQPINAEKLRLLGNVGQVIPIKFTNLKENKIQDAIYESEAIINLKTIWEENKIHSYKENILNFNIQLLDLINLIDKNKHFLFFSGLGVNENSLSLRSRYIAKTEEYIIENLINSSIIKPSIIIGNRDKFISKILPIIRFSFFVPVFGSGNAKLQPVFIDDLLKAIENILINKVLGKNKYELAGTEIFTYKNFYQYIAECLNVKRVFIPIPFYLAKIAVSLLEKTPLKLLTTDQLLLFKENNIVSNIDKNFSDLGIQANDTKIVIKKIIK